MSGTKRHYIIAMDGPAGSGKSTVAKLVARELGFVHADSGAMYRTVTLALIEKLGAGDTHQEFGEIVSGSQPFTAAALGCKVELVQGTQVNMLHGEDVGEKIRTPFVTERIRYIADNARYRELVNTLLRDFAATTDLVVDGRDIGTVVFPETPYKFYLDASDEVRARRRMEDYRSKGMPLPEMDLLIEEIRIRDQEDRNREAGALKQAQDAIYIDTSILGINDVVTRLLGHLQIQF